ncbi:unnamed protein product, partial [Brachionus calyciflorus]
LVLQAHYFLIGENDKNLFFWNNSQSFYSRKDADVILSLNYDFNTSKIYAGTKDKKIIEYSFTDTSYINILGNNEDHEVSTVLKINNTHIASAYEKNIVIINVLDNSKRLKYKNDSFGKIISMVLIKEKNVLIVGSDDKKSTFVYCLNQNRIISDKFLDSSIYAIDSLNQDLIINECYRDFVCLQGFNSSNQLIDLKSARLRTKIFGIQIVNQKFVLLACEKFLAVWNILSNKAVIYTKGLKEYKLNFIKIFNNQTFGVIQINTEEGMIVDAFSTESITSTTATTEITTPTTETITTITDSTTKIQSDDFFKNFIEKNLQIIIEIISTNTDVNDCIQNCSNNGKCKIINNSKYVCECNKNYVGSACQYKTLPCSSNPCLNNGLCEDNLSENNFKCQCLKGKNESEIYYGQYCEFKRNVCQNETCSNNGYCFDNDNTAKCKCFSMFSGEKCETKSNEMIAVESVIKTSSIIAILFIFLAYIFVLLNDILHCFGKNKIKK